ncbi:UDP-glucose 4-epimerase [Alishewanella longhuensis]|uniref:UDP-glucose 4-epimerase n=1 Tax=Alishewanella longhuensis TaxID=1091037 RepID=A0ABQ3KXK3_9ALTE|nr:SDR family oxidoreductase [Alishewanella longhuensis]GHG68008.1 UDP-glucose 4-epimerase [Alishewanella longhuensis]
MSQKIVVTGASGFIGKALVQCLAEQYQVVAPLRQAVDFGTDAIQVPIIQDIGHLPAECDWLANTDVVIHIAAMAHRVGAALADFQRVNTQATLALAQKAVDYGVKRFIFISSIGVLGASNSVPFKFNDTPAPEEPYAVSKLQAEIGLTQLAKATGLELVIIRPPLVYGPGAPGNFSKLNNLVSSGLPLPFGKVNNKRSFVALANVVDLISTCITHPKATNQTFLVSDDHDISTTELLKLMALAKGKAVWLLPVPVSCLTFVAGCFGKKALIQKFCGNLQVDINHTKTTLNWQPPLSVADGIAQCFKD